ncbi:oocyte zinc finger protein XlCOF7.1-like [Xyrichtys novacula]|uniref:Oocyte zinc finger protein XlCOF7.1-like n=1 Tax=Xyrichtys novacula TaxID=13765 RepID=A0AAV1HBD9_XYRNO|nr:oocyte zinc finger protein XlCOF7.1-like [Xyrichtys novacula]
MSECRDPKGFSSPRLPAVTRSDLSGPTRGSRDEEELMSPPDLDLRRRRRRAVCSPEIQQLSGVKEELHEQQGWSPSLGQEETKPPHIKDEQEELWSGQEEEELQGREVEDTTEFPFTVVTVKGEDDEEKPQCSQLHQRQTERGESDADGEDCGGSSNFDAQSHLHSEIEVKVEDFSEPETEDGEDYWEGRNHPPGSNPLENMSDTADRSHTCYECGKTFKRKGHLTAHMIVHTGEKPFSCSECGKSFNCKGNLTKHMIIHTGEKPFSCPMCGRTFNCRGSMTRHMLVHIGEKSFSCSECEKIFKSKGSLTQHMSVHREEKSFSCSECGKIFKSKGNLTQHLSVHSGEKPFICTVCGKRLKGRYYLAKHMRNHTREKPSECDDPRENQAVHKEQHSEEVPFIVVEIC